jgi:hypothetical protein
MVQPDIKPIVFTIDDIKNAWSKYRKEKAWRVLRAGEWTLCFKTPVTGDGVVRAEMINLRQEMSFPKYLKMIAE